MIGRKVARVSMASHHRHRRPAEPPVRSGRRHRERGASLVEFAFVAPFLVALLFGVIDYGMVLSDTIGLRQGVREAGRQATVANYGSSTSCALTGASGSSEMKDLMRLTKDRSDLCGRSSVRVAIRLQQAGSSAAVGDGVVLCSIAPLSSLTGFFDPLMDGRYVRSKVVMRIEKVDPAKPLAAAQEAAPPGQSWSWCTP